MGLAVLYILPFLTWLAAIASAALLIVLWQFGELRGNGLALLLGWYLAAGYCQFFSKSPVVEAVGIALQTFLAISLILRFRLDGWSRGRAR
jgi:hypothetical protein